MDNEPSLKWSFGFLLVSGLIGYGFRTLGMWADGGDFSVLNIMVGGPPELSWRSIAALVCYGIAFSCLGLVLGGLAMISRATMPGARVGSIDVLSGRHQPHEAAGQFRRYGWIIMLATLLVERACTYRWAHPVARKLVLANEPSNKRLRRTAYRRR